MDTSLTLLESLKSQSRSDAWKLLNDLYAPMIQRWLKQVNARLDDEDDVMQEVLVQVMNKIDTFEHNQQTGAFRSWLKQITVNSFRNYSRKNTNKALAGGGSDIAILISQLEDPHSELSQAWDQEHDRSVIGYLLNLVRPLFDADAWQAFRETNVNGRPTREVADELGKTVGSIHTSNSRVLAELRRMGQGLLDDSSFGL